MSASFDIQSASGPYRVHVRNHSFEECLKDFNHSTIIADEFFAAASGPWKGSAIFVAATEENKSLAASPPIVEAIRKLGANRQTELVAVGGGIIQDLSAFIASVYMRGINWSYVPTTVLAMVDSCIGGKSSINVGPYKNLVGTIHPPRQVLVDPAMAKTLPAEQVAAGLIEAAKICFCRGPQAFHRHMDCSPAVSVRAEALEAIVVNSLEAKKWFIEIDEFDRRERLLLNFGHTFGHAIEGASHYAVPHGIAVGLGILCALKFGRERGADYTAAPTVGALEGHIESLIVSMRDLSIHLGTLRIDEVLERFASDKKHTAERYALILVSEDGEVVLQRIERSPAATHAIENALRSVIQRFSQRVGE